MLKALSIDSKNTRLTSYTESISKMNLLNNKENTLMTPIQTPTDLKNTFFPYQTLS